MKNQRNISQIRAELDKLSSFPPCFPLQMAGGLGSPSPRNSTFLALKGQGGESSLWRQSSSSFSGVSSVSAGGLPPPFPSPRRFGCVMTLEEEIVEALGTYSYDAYGFVLWAFTWGEGELSSSSGPRKWQREILTQVGRGAASKKEIPLRCLKRPRYWQDRPLFVDNLMGFHNPPFDQGRNHRPNPDTA